MRRVPEDLRPPAPWGLRRSIHLAVWLLTALLGVLALSQGAGTTPAPALYALQALTPILLMLAIPPAVYAGWRRDRLLIGTNLGVVVAWVWLVAPVVIGPDRPAIDTGTPPLRIAHANVLFRNADVDTVARTLLATDADVLAITEYTPTLAAALAVSASARPYTVASPQPDPTGIGLLSRWPLIDARVAPIGHQPGIIATVDAPGGPVRVVVVHPAPAVDLPDLRAWRADLRAIGDVATSPGPPTVVVGDFNAARWHPDFRQLLDRGFVDAHEQDGDGWTTSWPMGRRLPPFVRLDHALLGHGLATTAVEPLVIPGSDHRGFVVDVARVARD